MTLTEILLIIAAVAALVGGAVLALSLDALLRAHDLSLTGLEIFRDGLAQSGGRDYYVVDGTDVHRRRGEKSARWRVRIGIGLLVVSFLCTIASVFTAKTDPAADGASAHVAGATQEA